RKLGTVFTEDLYVWMKEGVLKDMVRAIERPGFISKKKFADLIDKPRPFLWDLLTYDIFQNYVLKQ
ncbi:unnamed protein product, partial [marine sediment metagenome]